MNVAECFVQALEAEGVTHIFGVPGEENQDFLFALADSSIEFVPTRHENGASFIADVWGRLCGKPGVCMATLGPGATNLITGVADAHLDKAPLVAITGQGGTDRLHHESHQLIDVMKMYQPITKWNGNINRPDVVSEVVRKAFKVATTEKPGATHIELNEDIAATEFEGDFQPILPKLVRRPAPDYKAVRETIEALKSANKPLIIAGNGAIRKLASKHLTEFAEKYEIPVVGTFMGKGALSDKSPQSLFSIGLGFKDYIFEAIEESDLIVTVGYDIGEYAPQKWNPQNNKTIVHVDFVPAEVYENYNPEVEVVGNISGLFWELKEELSPSDLQHDREWYKPIRQKIFNDLQRYNLADKDELTVPGTLNIIRDVMPDDGLLISDVGSHKMWIARNYPTYVPNGTIISNGLASMGIALPGGIAAKLLAPKRAVVSAMGDGGFMMNSQELETAKRLGVGYTNIVFNDNDYGLISWKQRMATGTSTSTGLTNPDIKQYAESFGINGYRPTTAAEFKQTLEKTISSGELAVIELRVDPSVNQELFDKMKAYWQERS